MSKDFSENKIPIYTKKLMLEQHADFWIEKWIEKEELFFEITEVLIKTGIISYSNEIWTNYIYGIILSYPHLVNDKYFLEKIENYSLTISLVLDSKSYYGENLTNLLLYANKEIITLNLEVNKFELLTLEDLDKIKIHSNQSQAILNLIYTKHFQNNGFITLTGENIAYNNQVNFIITPIFKENKNKIFKGIANIIPFTKRIYEQLEEKSKINELLFKSKERNNDSFENALKLNLFDDYFQINYLGASPRGFLRSNES